MQLPEDFFRRESARLVAFLTGKFGLTRLAFAEDVAQETLLRALQTWPYRGLPDNPSAWLTQTAKNLAIDILRREQRWRQKEADLVTEHLLNTDTDTTAGDGHFADDTLSLIFACFHPQLSEDAQTALALRTLCGLSPAEIAAAFLTTEAAINKRLVRTRRRIRDLELPFALPGSPDLTARLDSVLATLYLLFNEGYKASSGDRLVRAELCHEAIRLATVLTGHPATAQPQTFALLALMLLNAARLPARSDDAGNLIRLHEQDRRNWDRTIIARGIQCLALAGRSKTLTTYHLEAGIAACHSTAASDADTDWRRILALYNQLLTLSKSPITSLNRAVALARVHGPQAALDALTTSPLDTYHLLHSVRGSLEFELGNHKTAAAHFQRAASLATLPSEQKFLAERIAECRA